MKTIADFHPRFIVGDSNLPREQNDFYRTPAYATKALLAREKFIGTIWEPACGDGAIATLLPPETFASDLYDHGYGEPYLDFLLAKKTFDHVITNPPYSIAQKFVTHALECTRSKVAMLLKLNFLEGQKRKRFFAETPLRTVYVFSARISFDKGNVAGKGNGMLAYAWYVWEKTYNGKPCVEWI